ncbi:MAG: hypothetical protein HZA36_01715 [Parcubacteria group bacterium]|nr:hypothetical protein [Parcubacteria group bacterium]
MQGDRYLDILENFNTKILEGLTRLLSEYKDEFKKRPIGAFHALTTHLANQAISKFKTLYPEYSKLEDATLHMLLMSTILEKFNETLPLDYPYIIVFLDIEDGSTTPPHSHTSTQPYSRTL